MQTRCRAVAPCFPHPRCDIRHSLVGRKGIDCRRGQKAGSKGSNQAFCASDSALISRIASPRGMQNPWKQLLRAGTSVGANYRAACRARSKAEFIAKLGIVVEEADETVFWLELLLESEAIEPA